MARIVDKMPGNELYLGLAALMLPGAQIIHCVRDPRDWVRDFDGTLARVLAHLGLPPDPACARFYDSDRDVHTVRRAQVRQPVHARGLGRWRTYAAELAPLIAELEGEVGCVAST